MEPPSIAWLEGVAGDLQGNRFPLGIEESQIGRGSNCSIQLADPMVSRQHAVIRFHDGVFILADLGSAHGTLVNGERIQESRLSDGDTLRFGDTDLRFRKAQDAIPTILPPRPAAVSVPQAKASVGVGEPSSPARQPLAAAPASGSTRTRKPGRTVVFACGGLSAVAACVCVVGLIAHSLTGGRLLNASQETPIAPPELEIPSASPAPFDPSVTYEIEEITATNAALELFMDMASRDRVSWTLS
jgi:predicted component of type VI protein secretion system